MYLAALCQRHLSFHSSEGRPVPRSVSVEHNHSFMIQTAFVQKLHPLRDLYTVLLTIVKQSPSHWP